MNARQLGDGRSIYEACCELFTDYPLAAKVVDHGGGRIVQSMVLMLNEDDSPQFFVLSHDSGEGRPSCSLRLWGARNIVNIEADGIAAVPGVIVKAVTYGVPIPQGWSLFGWNDRGVITTLTLFCTDGALQPQFTWMPLAGLPEAQWPRQVSESLFGRWFWDSHQAGKVVPLAGLIAGTLSTVYWVYTTESLGSGCCVVAREFGDPAGPMLRHGCYVYCEALRAGTPVPPLTALLAQTSKIDLGLQFQMPM